MRIAAKAQQLATQAVAGRPVDKVSCVAGFEPWGWVVGASAAAR